MSTALNLSKLTRAQSSAMVSELAGGKALARRAARADPGTTDGVPLFVEELTKSILESGELKTRAITTTTPALPAPSPSRPPCAIR